MRKQFNSLTVRFIELTSPTTCSPSFTGGVFKREKEIVELAGPFYRLPGFIGYPASLPPRVREGKHPLFGSLPFRISVGLTRQDLNEEISPPGPVL